MQGISRALGVALVLWALWDDPWMGGGPGFGLSQAALAGAGLVVFGTSFAPLMWNTRILALLLSTAFVLVIGEVAVRILFSARYERPFVPDERLIYRLSPGSTSEHIRQPVNGGERIVYRVNAEGYRGDDLVVGSGTRVVVFGDSFIQGEFSSLDATFVEQFEDRLAERLGKETEAVNAGVAGYGPGQTLRKMELELANLDPDLVVIAIFAGNDFGDMLRNKLYGMDEDGVLVATEFRIGPEQRRALEVQHKELMLKRVLRQAVHDLGRRFGLGRTPADDIEGMLPRERMDHFLGKREQEYEEYVVQGNHVVHSLSQDTYDADMNLTPGSESARYKARLMEAVLGRMRELAEEQGVPIVLVPVPHPIDVGGHASAEVDHARYPDYDPRAMVDILEAIAERQGLPVVDLFMRFESHGSDVVYFEGLDDHWNDHGQALAARWVADFVMERGLLRGVTTPVAVGEQGG